MSSKSNVINIDSARKETRLEEGVEYYATIDLISTAGTTEVKIRVSRGPAEYLEGADENGYVEIPGSWELARRIIDNLRDGIYQNGDTQEPEASDDSEVIH